MVDLILRTVPQARNLGGKAGFQFQFAMLGSNFLSFFRPTKGRRLSTSSDRTYATTNHRNLHIHDPQICREEPCSAADLIRLKATDRWVAGMLLVWSAILRKDHRETAAGFSPWNGEA